MASRKALPPFKVVLLGNSGVGKSNLLSMLNSGEFSHEFKSTVGVEFLTKQLEVDGTIVKAQIWDTAGQERFRTITTSYFKGAQGILLVYDVTDRKTFQAIGNWIAQINQHADKKVNNVLIGNKCDMEDQRAVSVEEGRELANEFGMSFFETSAKQDTNVEAAFLGIASMVQERILSQGPTSGPGGAKLSAAPPPKKTGCC